MKGLKYLNGLLVVFMFVAGVSLASSLAIAGDSVVDVININVPMTCTLSGVGMTSHNATINNGQYNSAVGETTIKAVCNDTNGFAIYAIGYTDDEDGKNVLTDSALDSSFDIATGTGTSGTSQWAMKLSTVSSPAPTYPIAIQNGFGSFHTVPDDYVMVAKRESATDAGSNPEGSILKSTYQAYISTNQPSGTYNGQVKYTLVHPYNADAPIKPVFVSDLVYMQDVASLSSAELASLKENMVVGEQHQLIDSRDNKTYYFAKQADGKIWMTQNLDLCIGCSGVATLTSSNTDLNASGSGGYVSGYTESNGVITWTPASTAITSSTTISGNTVSPAFASRGTGYITPYSAEGGDVYLYTSGNNNSDTEFNSLSACEAVHDDNTCPHYHLGNYYNWSAAIASNDSSGIDEYSYETASNSICPAGWRLPQDEVHGNILSDNFVWESEFQQLLLDSGIEGGDWSYTEDGFIMIRSTPVYLVRGGYIWNGGRNDYPGYGYYWAGTAFSDPENEDANETAVGVLFNQTFINDYNAGARNGGRNVRCLVR